MLYNEVKKFWEDAGRKELDKDGLRPTVRDPYLQLLIEKSILPYLSKKSRILEIGCGDALSTIKFARRAHSVIGIDYSAPLLNRAKANVKKSRIKNIKLVNMDAQNISPERFSDINCVISIRCLINVNCERLQYKILNKISRILSPGGYLLCAEGYNQGLAGLNRRREAVGLKKINTVKHNKFLNKNKFEKFVQDKFHLIDFRGIGLYLYLSRLVHPVLVRPDMPRHHSPLNKFFMKLQLMENNSEFLDCSYTGLHIFQKKN